MAFEVPLGWRQIRLDEFLSIQRGHDLPKRSRKPGDVPVIGASGRVGWHDEAVASGPSFTIGRAASIGNLVWETQDFWPLNTTLYVTDAHGNDLRFAYYLLHTIDFHQYNSGSVQPMLNRNFVAGHQLTVPPIDEQRAIAAVLGAFDDRIEWCDHGNQLAHDIARCVAERGASESAVPLMEVAELKKLTVSSNKLGGSLWTHYSIPAFDEGQLPVVESGSNIRSGKLAVPDSAVLVSKLNPTWPRVWLPAVYDDPPAICSTELLPLVPHSVSPANTACLWASMLTADFNRQLREHATGSTGSHQRVRTDDMLACRVMDPATLTPAEADLLQHLAGCVRELREQRRSLSSTREALLPRLLSGELRIEDPSQVVGVGA